MRQQILHQFHARVQLSCLPKLALSKFRGDITQWSSFWDLFKSAVHSNPDLPIIDKFNYLNSLIEGQPEPSRDSPSVRLIIMELGPTAFPSCLIFQMVQFQWHRIAITDDIEKAFLVVSIDPPDHEFLCFYGSRIFKDSHIK